MSSGGVTPVVMSKKNIVLLSLLAALGSIYVYYFTDLFRQPTMEIVSRIRPQINQRRSKREPIVPAGNTISFLFNRKYELTSVKVVEENEAKTNKYPHAVWRLITDSNSVPTKTIFYGVTVEGMKPEFAKSRPEPLQPNVPYILLIEAGKLKGQTTFSIR